MKTKQRQEKPIIFWFWDPRNVQLMIPDERNWLDAVTANILSLPTFSKRGKFLNISQWMLVA